MAQISLQGNPVHTVGKLPAIKTQAPAFILTKTDLSDCTLKEYAGKTVILNIFPSIDTSVCAASVRRFNKEAGELTDTVVLCVSADLPFAHQRFCEGEGLKNVIPLSNFRSPDFGKDYGLTIISPPLTGLLSRAIVVIDPTGWVTYTQQAPEITEEPDYEDVLRFLRA